MTNSTNLTPAEFTLSRGIYKQHVESFIPLVLEMSGISEEDVPSVEELVEVNFYRAGELYNKGVETQWETDPRELGFSELDLLHMQLSVKVAALIMQVDVAEIDPPLGMVATDDTITAIFYK